MQDAWGVTAQESAVARLSGCAVSSTCTTSGDARRVIAHIKGVIAGGVLILRVSPIDMKEGKLKLQQGIDLVTV